MTAQAQVSLPVSVILAKKLISRGAWSVPSWRAIAVVAGDSLASADANGSLVREMDDEQHYLWGGLSLELFRDSAHSYWSNLVGNEPSLFVMCHEHEGGDVQPVSVTADAEDASAAIEGSDPVFAVSIPPEIYLQLERFVVEHHKPTPPRKRKRKTWSKQG